MTHQIPPHLAFCTPGQNQEAKPRNKSRDNKESHAKQTTRQTDYILLNESCEKKGIDTSNTQSVRELDTYGNHPIHFKTKQEDQSAQEVNQKQQNLTRYVL